MEVINFHTHTCRCRHASGTVKDYLQSASDAGLRVIGIADHAPEPLDSTDSRMPLNQLPEYIAEVRSAAEEFRNMEVFLGVEAERFPHFGMESLKNIYTGKYHFDYLIGAVHPGVYYWEDADTPDGVLEICRRIVKENIQMIESGLFVCMAHPDIAGVLIDTWGGEHARIFRELIVAAADCGCFLEFNTYGMRKPLKNTASGARWQYPLIPFWLLAAELKAPAVIGIDVHRPSDITAGWVEAEKILHGFGMTPANDRMLEAIRKSVQKNS